jgi:3D (Asp-Asp-Asp) domain-containing protein
MRFEDYLDRQLYESVCKENANRRNYQVRQVERERRREKSRNTMSIITGICFVVIFLLLFLCTLTQNEPKETDEDLPMEVATASILAENPVVTIEEEVQEDFENEKIQNALIDKANRIDNVVVSHYCAEKYPHICNAGEPYKTALGHDVVPGLTCAVDPNMIPLGSTVFVDYGDGVIYEYFASDTGGAIKDKRLDVAVDTHSYALQCGLKNATVWWIKE